MNNRITRYLKSPVELAISDLLFVAAMDRAECLDAELRDMKRHSDAVVKRDDECGEHEEGAKQ